MVSIRSFVRRPSLVKVVSFRYHSEADFKGLPLPDTVGRVIRIDYQGLRPGPLGRSPP
jgi:hypothetical protein